MRSRRRETRNTHPDAPGTSESLEQASMRRMLRLVEACVLDDGSALIEQSYGRRDRRAGRPRGSIRGYELLSPTVAHHADDVIELEFLKMRDVLRSACARAKRESATRAWRALAKDDPALAERLTKVKIQATDLLGARAASAIARRVVATECSCAPSYVREVHERYVKTPRK